MELSCIIFDCDGVLRTASWLGIYEAYKEMCSYLGIDHELLFPTLDEFKKWFNADWRNNLARIGGGAEEKVETMNEIFHGTYDSYIQVFPWTGETARLLAGCHNVAILSSSRAVSIRKTLGAIAENFRMIVGCEHVQNLKPHPEGIELIMRALGFKPRETWMIGDMDVDIQSGVCAGVRTAGVTWGLTESKEEWGDCEPDEIFTNPQQLLEHPF